MFDLYCLTAKRGAIIMQVRAKKNCNALFDRHFSVKNPVRPGDDQVFA
jgi:hypothetical protein